MDEAFTKNVEQLEQALVLSLVRRPYEFAVELRDSGVSQADLLAIFTEVRARHLDDPDESKCDALADIMDIITGWCSPSKALYPNTNT
jgi:hypothetical protein